MKIYQQDQWRVQLFPMEGDELFSVLLMVTNKKVHDVQLIVVHT